VCPGEQQKCRWTFRKRSEHDERLSSKRSPRFASRQEFSDFRRDYWNQPMSNGNLSSSAGVGKLASLLAWLARWRYFPLIAAALGLLLASPALGAGWILDDYYHRTVMLPASPFRELLGPPAEMFRFFRGDLVRTKRVMDVGIFPWWTDPCLKAEFLQVLTVLTHRFDYALWPESPVLMHAQSLCWLGTMVAVVAAFYRRMIGPTHVAAVAALLFAVDDARGTTVGFIANRNVMVAATFGVWALICHDRWRRDGSGTGALLAPLLLAAALFSKEEGIGTCAYLAAYGLFADPAGRRRGCVALSPYLAVLVIWRALRGYWGYGVQNMGLYVDPLGDPGPFLAALFERAPILLLGQWSPVPAESGAMLRPPASTAFWWAAVAFLASVTVVLAPLLKRDRLARFWAAGMLMATIPVCATLASDRLLTFAGIGAFGLLAQFLAFAFGRSPGAPSTRLWRVPAGTLASFFVVVHLMYAPIALPFRAANPAGPRWVWDRAYIQVPLGPAISDKDLVVVNAPDPVQAAYVAFQQVLVGQPAPRHIRVLAPAMPRVTIRRLDLCTLEITPSRGYIDFLLDRVFRSERRPMVLGQEVRLTGMTARVTALTADGRPAVATFQFDVPLESGSLVWLCFRGRGFEPFSPPPVGRHTSIRFDWKAMLLP
jgi:hypothetical protein